MRYQYCDGSLNSWIVISSFTFPAELAEPVNIEGTKVDAYR